MNEFITLHEIMKDINSIPEENRLTYATNKYLVFFNNVDIIQYFLVKHCSFYDLFKEFNYLNIANTKTELVSVTTDEIFSLLDYPEFNNFTREEIKDYENVMHLDLWPEGTWNAPIIAVGKNNKYIAIDGNNRLRMLRMYIKYSNSYIKNKHSLYLISEV